MATSLTSARPYMLRAIHEWMTDNGETPLVIVDAGAPDVQVPPEHVNDEQIVLNISWSATQNLQLGNERLEFDARFGGVPQHVSLPVAAVRGIYARESGQGMMFQDEPETPGTNVETNGDPSGAREDGGSDGDGKKAGDDRSGNGRGGLRVVK